MSLSTYEYPISPYTCAKVHMLVNRNVCMSDIFYHLHHRTAHVLSCSSIIVDCVKLYALWFFSETVKK